MSFSTILSTIDSSMAPSPASGVAASPQRKSGLGRRFMLGAAASGLAVAGYACFHLTSLGSPAAPMVAAPAAALPTAVPADEAETTPDAADRRDWAAFRARFIQPDGRVIDSTNGGVSHTESQGLGMLFATTYNDRASFDRIWNWTSGTLSRGSDALHAWRYVPGPDPVADLNNATDGDIYIAAALVRASTRWNDPAYLQAAQAIARDILALLVRDVGGRVVLLPAAAGFDAADHVVVNASYYIFPLIQELQEAYPSPIWTRLLDDGRKLIAEAQFGQWRLPPDWLSVSASDGALSLAEGQKPRFSFDAVRIPLFIAWDRGNAQDLSRFTAFWGPDAARAPAWVDLQSGLCAPYATCGGVIAIARLTESRIDSRAQRLPAISLNDDYYSSALILLARQAGRETETRTS